MHHLDHVCTSAALSLESGSFSSSPLHMPPSKRPKLSLQTSQLSASYASSGSTTGSSVATLFTTTPTTLNTLSNSFDLTIRPSPTSATTSPASFQLRSKPAASPLRRSQPYSLNLPLGVRPILKNSRITKDYRASSLSASASPRTARRVFFPPAKKVSFQTIDEEIITQIYTAQHFDLSSSEDEQTESGSEKNELPEQDIGVPPTQETSEPVVFENEVTISLQDKYQSPELVNRSRRRRQRSTSTPRLVKKKRRWEWTIGDTEHGDVADNETLTPLSPLLAQTSNDKPSDASSVPQSDTADVPIQKTSANEQQESVSATVDVRTPAADVRADNTESSETKEATTHAISLGNTALHSDEQNPLPSSRQADKPSIVKALMKLFEQERCGDCT